MKPFEEIKPETIFIAKKSVPSYMPWSFKVFWSGKKIFFGQSLNNKKHVFFKKDFRKFYEELEDLRPEVKAIPTIVRKTKKLLRLQAVLESQNCAWGQYGFKRLLMARLTRGGRMIARGLWRL